jgi:hypothetical protein
LPDIECDAVTAFSRKTVFYSELTDELPMRYPTYFVYHVDEHLSFEMASNKRIYRYGANHIPGSTTHIDGNVEW